MRARASGARWAALQRGRGAHARARSRGGQARGRGTETRASDGRDPRQAIARHPVRGEGSTCGPRCADDVGGAAISRPGLRRGRNRRRAAPEGRRGPGGEARDGGARRRRWLPLPERVPAGTRPQSVEPRAVVGRVVERVRRRSRRRHRAVCDRFGDLGLDRDTVGLLRRDRAATDLRPRAASRRDGPLLDPRQARSDGPDRRRLRDRARGDRWSGCRRSHLERSTVPSAFGRRGACGGEEGARGLRRGRCRRSRFA